MFSNETGMRAGDDLRTLPRLLLAAGFAPMYSEAAWGDDEMRSIAAAVERMLRLQEPYPAVLMDRYWNVVSANAAPPRFFNAFIDVHNGVVLNYFSMVTTVGTARTIAAQELRVECLFPADEITETHHRLLVK